MEKEKISVLIVGASGTLGSLVTKQALKQDNFLVNILVRSPEKIKDLANEVEKAGGKVLQGDLSKPETLKDVTKGIHTVISCISVTEDKDCQAQINLLDDALKNKVKRFFPSHYGVNYENASPGNRLIDAKLKFLDHLSKCDIQSVVITAGFIVECYLDVNGDGLRYYGDINQKIDLTCYNDVAQYIVTAATNPNTHGKLTFVSQELSTKEIEEIYNKVRGTNIQAQCAGSVEDIRQDSEQKKKDNHKKAVLFDVLYLIYSGKAKIHATNNSEFPQIHATLLQEFLKENPDIKIK